MVRNLLILVALREKDMVPGRQDGWDIIHHMHHCIYWKQIGQNVTNVCSEVGARAIYFIIFCTFHAYLKCQEQNEIKISHLFAY